MGRTIWRYTLTSREQKLWDRDDMKGWCKALEGCVEDDAREQGMKKYIIQDTDGEVVIKSDVTILPDPKAMETRRETTVIY